MMHYKGRRSERTRPKPSRRTSALLLSEQSSMNRDVAVSPTMEGDVSGMGADSRNLAAHQRPSMALVVFPLHVCRNATVSPLADHDAVPSSPSIPLSANELMVAGLPATQTSITVREVVVAPATAVEPAITLGYHSLDDFKLITSLPFIVTEED
jgi:hypothetical protein